MVAPELHGKGNLASEIRGIAAIFETGCRCWPATRGTGPQSIDRRKHDGADDDQSDE